MTQRVGLHLPRPWVRLTGPAMAFLLDVALWVALYVAYRLVKAAIS